MANELINVITDHSINKSRITIPDLVEFANTLQASTIIITDYDTVSGAAELISLCSNSGIKSSVGVKIRMQYDDIEGYTALIAKNYKGYIAIGKALRDSSNGRNNPLMDKSVFEKYFGVGSVGHDNVIVTTCGIDGLIFKMTEQDSYPVVSALEYFIGVVGRDNFFVEMQFHGYLVEQKIYPYLAEIADSLNINLVATNDPVFIHGNNDDILLDLLKYANDRKVPSVSSARHYYVKNHEQLKETLTPILYESQVDKAVVNISLGNICRVGIDSY